MSVPNVNLLLLAAMQRAGQALTSDDLLDYATGYAIDAGWDPEDIRGLNRRSIAKRLSHMERTGLARREGELADPGHGQVTPLWVPVAGFNRDARLPPKPETALKLARAEKASRQMRMMLQHHNRLIETVTRFLGEMQGINAALVAELRREDDR